MCVVLMLSLSCVGLLFVLGVLWLCCDRVVIEKLLCLCLCVRVCVVFLDCASGCVTCVACVL